MEPMNTPNNAAALVDRLIEFVKQADFFSNESHLAEVAEQLATLRATLAQPDALTSQPSGEAVAWLITWNDGRKSVSFDKCHPDDGTCVPLTHPSADAGVAVDEIALAAKSSGLFLSAYYKACESSKPADWHEAAMLAKQWHCRIDEALTAALAPKPEGEL